MFRFLRIRLQLLLGIIIAVLLGALVYFFYLFISARLIEDLRIEAQNRGALFAGSIRGDIQRYVIVPRILAQDQTIVSSLQNYRGQYADDLLTRLSEELGDSVLFIADLDGQILAANDLEKARTINIDPTNFVQAAQIGRSSYYDTLDRNFVNLVRVDGAAEEEQQIAVGYLGIAFSFERYSEIWRRLDVNMMLFAPTGEVLLARDEVYIGKPLQDVLGLSANDTLTGILSSRVFNIGEEAHFVFSSEIGVNGWRLLYAIPAGETRQTINGYVGLLIFSIAFLVISALYLLSRRAVRSAIQIRRESEDLRALNARLITEIEQRQKAEQSLQSAEQSLEQSAKLAVIGQMSAAVGHELNQPLAAMRTYLAGVRMLLRRSRFFDAAQNLNRIEDLLDRMGSITRQMRSFARAHENEMRAFDLNTSILSAFSLMAPQLGQMKVEINRKLPDHVVMVFGDQIRTEQILVNILRNALEATKDEPLAHIDIELIESGATAKVTIKDNGPGFEDADKLFEPFFTTKAPGEGLGLGLAISASYARDMGGNLLARDNEPHGAVFELTLSLYIDKKKKGDAK